MKNRGFTLVELLAVIVILTIILSIAVPTISSILNETAKKAFEADAKLIIKTTQYKLLENSAFDISNINENTLFSLLNLSEKNYDFLSLKYNSNNKIFISIIGDNNWTGLTANGTFDNIIIENAINIEQNGLIVHYDSENVSSYSGTGTNLYSLTGSNNGTLIGGATFDYSTKSFSFMNQSSNITLPTMTVVDSPNISVFAFLKVNSGSGGYPFGVWGHGNASNQNSHFEITNNTWRVRLGLFDGNYGTLQNIGNWQYVGFSYNGAKLDFYVNGVKINTANGVSGSIFGSGGTYGHSIGNSHGNLRALNGNISNVQIYNNALSEAEVLQNYNSLKGRFGL